MSNPAASVVIGFKDWGLDRLRRCIDSTLVSFGDVPVEVIVSDYGSADGESVATTSSDAGARYVRTETDGTWSRSRALNAGFGVALGEQFFATDADMIFTPGALESVSRRLHAFPGEAIILQCRDLPPEVGTEEAGTVDWDRCERLATVRPRWGMGGLVATHRSVFWRLRGYDERMHTYGGEDIDYGKRLRRYGVPINWLDRRGIRMYHVWHPSSRLAASFDEAAEAAIALNRRIHTEDPTSTRNRVNSGHFSEEMPPIVSVVAAVDRRLEELAPELSNVLGQTIVDLELLLVDTNGQGSSVAEHLDDDRVRVIAAPEDAWWRAVEQAEGTYAVLHAPGTWSGPRRLERLLEHTGQRHLLPADVALAAIVSDRDELLALPVSEGAAQRRPWASLLLPTDLARAVIQSLGSDATTANDLVFALLRNGLTVDPVAGTTVEVMPGGGEGELHLEELARSAQHLVRRLRSHDLPSDWITRLPGADEITAALRNTQQLIRDQVDLAVWSSDEEVLEVATRITQRTGQARRSRVTDMAGETLFGLVEIAGLPGTLARRLRRLASASATRGNTKIEELADDAAVAAASPLTKVLQEYSRLYAGDPESATWVIARTDSLDATTLAVREMECLAGVSVVLHRVLYEGESPPHYLVLGLAAAATAGLSALLAARSVVSHDTVVDLWLGEAHRNVLLEDLVGSYP